jgi:hypothetical protein
MRYRGKIIDFPFRELEGGVSGATLNVRMYENWCQPA